MKQFQSQINLFALFIIALLVIAYPPHRTQADSPPKFSQQIEQRGPWAVIAPAGETTCAENTPYYFLAREGVSQNLLIYFEGGGACWDYSSCAGIFPLYFSEVRLQTADTRTSGIFDFDHPNNPFSDYDMVFVSYCTGDLHMGGKAVTYSSGENQATIQHKGYQNVKAILAWAQTNFPTPSSLFVIGGSAGGYGALANLGSIRQQPAYRDLPLTYLLDSSIGVTYQYWSGFEGWGVPDLLQSYGIDPKIMRTALPMVAIFKVLAVQYPNVNFHFYTSYSDRVQALFYEALGGNEADWQGKMKKIVAELADSVANFRYFVAGGKSHTVIGQNLFYAIQSSGKALSEWVREIVAGQPVQSYYCKNCAVAEFTN
jgi:hypothetical protein